MQKRWSEDWGRRVSWLILLNQNGRMLYCIISRVNSYFQRMHFCITPSPRLLSNHNNDKRWLFVLMVKRPLNNISYRCNKTGMQTQRTSRHTHFCPSTVAVENNMYSVPAERQWRTVLRPARSRRSCCLSGGKTKPETQDEGGEGGSFDIQNHFPGFNARVSRFLQFK